MIRLMDLPRNLTGIKDRPTPRIDNVNVVEFATYHDRVLKGEEPAIGDAVRRRPACPSRASGWSSLTTPRGFPCCVRFKDSAVAALDGKIYIFGGS